MDRLYVAIALGLGALILLPALVAGGGFILAGVLAFALLLAFLGGPKLWDLHMNKSMGERGRADVRDLIQGGDDTGRRQPNRRDGGR